MKHRAWVRWVSSVGALLLVGGCSGSSNDDDDDDGSVNGAGSPTCQQWQTSICNFAERCGGNAALCREQAPGIACLSDAEAQRCTAEFEAAACTSLPTGCDFSDIADPAPAIDKCNAFIQAICSRGEECEPGTQQDCLTQAAGSLNCAAAIGIKPSFDQCLSEVAVLDCEATSAPVSCQGVVLLSGP